MNTISDRQGTKRKSYCRSFCYICGTKEFPDNGPTRALWFNFIGLPKDSDDYHLHLCSKHFSADELKKEARNFRLREGAIPTLFPSVSKKPCPPHQIWCVLCRGEKTDGTSIRFPGCVELRKKWAHFCGIPPEQVTAYTFLCSRHFHNDDFIVTRWMKEQPKKELKATAVPSIHLENEYKVTSRSNNTQKQRRYCHICGCQESDTSYFLFPKKDEQKSKWRRICKLSDDVDTKKLFICAHHFPDDEKVITLKHTNLKDTALPSLHLGRFSELLPDSNASRSIATHSRARSPISSSQNNLVSMEEIVGTPINKSPLPADSNESRSFATHSRASSPISSL